MKFIDLFAGIGSFRRGMEAAEQEGKVMRLIDADAFKTQLATAAIKEGSIYSAKMVSNFCELIDMQPEIQYTPENTEVTEAGSDEIFCHWYRCQKCGQDNIMEGTCYCPDCGKKIIWQGGK